jgi:hypothetical protein
MKYIILFALSVLSVEAHEIEGTLVLKGTLRTETVINAVKTKCRVRIDDVKNLMREDSFGNPAYLLKVEVSLDGKDSKRKIKIKTDEKVVLTNLFQENGASIVKDFDYANPSGTIKLKVKSDGRMESIQLPYERSTVTCRF